jgi:hypothetical protein
MKTADCLQNKIVLFEYTEAEQLNDENCNERNSEVKENRLLIAIKSTLRTIDLRDGILDNDLILNNAKKVCEQAIKENEYQYQKNLSQQKILDKFIDFPEKLPDRKEVKCLIK